MAKARMAELQEVASRPPENSVFSARPRGTAAIRIRPGDACGLQYLGVNIAPCRELLLRNVLIAECHTDPKCHIANVALIRIAHCDDKADNDKFDLRTVQTLNGS